MKHGYFLNGFLNEDERALYERVATWGEVESWELKRALIAAMVVRAARMTLWEAEDGEASPHTAAAYTQLRQTLEKFGFGAPLTRPPPHADPPRELLRDGDRELLRRMLMPEETEDEESGGQEQEG